MRIFVTTLLLIFFASAASAVNVITDELPTKEVSVEYETETFPLEESVESLMSKKIDLVNKIERMEQIESVISTPEVEAKALAPDPNQYKPLQDSATKQMQSRPPFQVQQ